MHHSTTVIGVYHIDPNGGHPVDSLQVMCDFDESCSTCIDPNEMVEHKPNIGSALQESSLYIPCLHFHSLQFHYSSLRSQGSHSRSYQISQEKVYVEDIVQCLLQGQVICPVTLSSSCFSPLFSSPTKSTSFSSRCCR